MADFLLLNGLFLLFALQSALESDYRPTLAVRCQTNIPGPVLLLIVLALFTGIIALLAKGPNTILQLYIYASFNLLVIGHAVWLSLGRSKLVLTSAVLASLGILAVRSFRPSPRFHTVIIFIASTWIGSFLYTARLLTPRRFYVISVFLFCYDIIFVWLSPLSAHIVTTTQRTGFPLALGVGGSFIGLGDLLWANLFLTTLRSRWMQAAGTILLVVSNLLLGWYAISFHEHVRFPLLVLWVPLGLFFLHFMTPQTTKTAEGHKS